jgi:hypothetical protein
MLAIKLFISSSPFVDAVAYMIGAMMMMRSMNASTSAGDTTNLVREAALGNVDNVRAIINRYPDQVRTRITLCYGVQIRHLRAYITAFETDLGRSRSVIFFIVDYWLHTSDFLACATLLIFIRILIGQLPYCSL